MSDRNYIYLRSITKFYELVACTKIMFFPERKVVSDSWD